MNEIDIELAGGALRSDLGFSLPGLVLASGIVPDIHLRQYSKARHPVITVAGDSTYTVAANGLSQSEYVFTEIIRRVRACIPHRVPSFLNRAIPGATVNLMNQSVPTAAPGLTVPSWYTTPGAAWLSYIQNTSPDLVIVGHGMNGGSTWSTNAVQSIISQSQAWTKIPDWVFCTPLVPSLVSDLGAEAEQDARDQAAGWIRTASLCGKFGLIDFHRFMRAVRDGVDVAITEPKAVDDTFNGPLPYYYAGEKVHDYRRRFVFPGAMATLLAGGSIVKFALSGREDNFFQILLNAGNYSIGIYEGGGIFYSGFIASAGPGASGDFVVDVEVKGANLYVQANGVQLWNAPVPRFGGAFRPKVERGGTQADFAVRVEDAWDGQPRRLRSTAGDQDIWSVPADGPFGGAKNHPTSKGVSRIYRPVLDATDFTQAGSGPIHDIATAGAIDKLCSQVRLTGPSAGSYAVTLAAPDRRDAGRILDIEMVATTGSNPVILALTNVVGGSAGSTATFDAAGERLILLAGASKWFVLREGGASLS